MNGRNVRRALASCLLLASLAYSGANNFGVAPTGSSFPGWEPYTWSSASSGAFIQEYNINSGIVSLGGQVSRCCFSVMWAGQTIEPYSTNGNPWCSSFPSGNIVSVGSHGSWYRQINSNSVWPVSANPACSSGGLSFFVRTGLPPQTCNAYNCIQGTCVPQSGGTQRCQCNQGWYGVNCDMIVPPSNSSYFFVELTWKNVVQGEGFGLYILNGRDLDDCKWYLRSYPEDQRDGSLLALSSFDMSPKKLLFSTAQGAAAAKMGVWLVTRKLASGETTTCGFQAFMGHIGTSGCFKQTGVFPGKACYHSSGELIIFQIQQI